MPQSVHVREARRETAKPGRQVARRTEADVSGHGGPSGGRHLSPVPGVLAANEDNAGKGFAELAEDEGEKSVQTARFRFNCSISQIRLAAGRWDRVSGPGPGWGRKGSPD